MIYYSAECRYCGKNLNARVLKEIPMDRIKLYTDDDYKHKTSHPDADTYLRDNYMSDDIQYTTTTVTTTTRKVPNRVSWTTNYSKRLSFIEKKKSKDIIEYKLGVSGCSYM